MSIFQNYPHFVQELIGELSAQQRGKTIFLNRAPREKASNTRRRFWLRSKQKSKSTTASHQHRIFTPPDNFEENILKQAQEFLRNSSFGEQNFEKLLESKYQWARFTPEYPWIEIKIQEEIRVLSKELWTGRIESNQMKIDASSLTKIIITAVAFTVAALLIYVIRNKKDPENLTLCKHKGSDDFYAFLRFLKHESLGDDQRAVLVKAKNELFQRLSPKDFSFKLITELEDFLEIFRILAKIPSADVEISSFEAGRLWDPEFMVSVDPTFQPANNVKYLVWEESVEDKPLIIFEGRVISKAQVTPCTADYFALLNGTNGPVTKFVAEHLYNFIEFEEAYARQNWTCSNGLLLMGTSALRLELGEALIQNWVEAFRNEIKKHYGEDSSKVPKIRDEIGIRFNIAQMRVSDNEQPGYDAEVTAVVERDNVPQRGLGIDGEHALLHCIVEVTELT